jgi:hypothetical protein
VPRARRRAPTNARRWRPHRLPPPSTRSSTLDCATGTRDLELGLAAAPRQSPTRSASPAPRTRARRAAAGCGHRGCPPSGSTTTRKVIGSALPSALTAAQKGRAPHPDMKLEIVLEHHRVAAGDLADHALGRCGARLDLAAHPPHAHRRGRPLGSGARRSPKRGLGQASQFDRGQRPLGLGGGGDPLHPKAHGGESPLSLRPPAPRPRRSPAPPSGSAPARTKRPAAPRRSPHPRAASATRRTPPPHAREKPRRCSSQNRTSRAA